MHTDFYGIIFAVIIALQSFKMHSFSLSHSHPLHDIRSKQNWTAALNRGLLTSKNIASQSSSKKISSKFGKYEGKPPSNKHSSKGKIDKLNTDSNVKEKYERLKTGFKREKAKVLQDKLSTSQTTKFLKNKQKPDIFIIGVQKGGTTSLHDLFTRHPNICHGGLKEKHFFNADANWDKGPKFYDRLFSMCSPGKRTCDSTPMFAVNVVPQRIASFYNWESIKAKKFILILRHPIAREFSYFKHQMRECERLIKQTVPVANIWFATRSCETVSTSYTPGQTSFDPITFQDYYRLGRMLRQKSYYLQQLRLWLSVIRRKQLFILNMETLLVNTSAVMDKLKVFLGLPTGWGNISLPHENDSSFANATLDCDTFDRLKAHYDIVNAGLYDFIRTATDKPMAEPYFPDFALDKKRPCVEMGDSIFRDANNDKATDVYTQVNIQQRPDIFLIGFHHYGMIYTKNLFAAREEICLRGTTSAASLNDTVFGGTFVGHLGHTSPLSPHGEGGDDDHASKTDSYLQQFSSCLVGQKIVDMSTTFHRMQAPMLLHSWFTPTEIKKKKFILILQDPIVREYAVFRQQAEFCGNLLPRLLQEQQQQQQKQKLEHQRDQNKRARYGSRDHHGIKSCHTVWHRNDYDNITKIMSFQEYVDAGHVDDRHWLYTLYLQSWLDVINRDQLFVFSFDALVKNTSETVGALSAFLGLLEGDGRGRVEAKSLLSLGRLAPADVEVSAADCEQYYALTRSFALRNAGLFALLNSAQRPALQPLFEPFRDLPPNCIDAIAGIAEGSEVEDEADANENEEESGSQTAESTESGQVDGKEFDGQEAKVSKDYVGTPQRPPSKTYDALVSPIAAPTREIVIKWFDSKIPMAAPPFEVSDLAAASVDSVDPTGSTGSVSSTATAAATAGSTKSGNRRQKNAQWDLSSTTMAVGALVLLLCACCLTLLLGFVLQFFFGLNSEFVANTKPEKKRGGGHDSSKALYGAGIEKYGQVLKKADRAGGGAAAAMEFADADSDILDTLDTLVGGDNGVPTTFSRSVSARLLREENTLSEGIVDDVISRRFSSAVVKRLRVRAGGGVGGGGGGGEDSVDSNHSY